METQPAARASTAAVGDRAAACVAVKGIFPTKGLLFPRPLPAAWHCAGTGADLRRLSNKRAGEILETKFGLDPAVVQTIARWDRIDLIRT